MIKIKAIKKMTPGRAIRMQCLNCVGGAKDVPNCGGHGLNPLYDYCHFFPYRMGRGRPSVKIIRKFCLHCMGGSRKLVRECTTINCPCHIYRMGKNPTLAGKGQSAEAMAVVRSKKQGVAYDLHSRIDDHLLDNRIYANIPKSICETIS